MVNVLLYLSRIEILHVSVRHNAAGPQNNVPSESSFATKSALFGPQKCVPFSDPRFNTSLYRTKIRLSEFKAVYSNAVCYPSCI